MTCISYAHPPVSFPTLFHPFSPPHTPSPLLPLLISGLFSSSHQANQRKLVEHIVAGSVKKIEKLLEQGLDPNFVTEDGSELYRRLVRYLCYLYLFYHLYSPHLFSSSISQIPHLVWCVVATAMCSASCLCCLVEHISTSAGRMASRPCTEPPLEAIPRQLRYRVQYSQGASEASPEKFMPFWGKISTILACFPNLFP